MSQVTEMMELVIAKLGDVARSDLVVGEPIVLEGVTLVPLTQVAVGLGAGGGEGEGGAGPTKEKAGFEQGHGKGGGAGGGGRIRPVAVIVFTAEGVRVEPIPDRRGVLDKLMDWLPEVVGRIQEREKAAKPCC